MATLTEVSFYTRRIIVFTIIGFFIILISPLILGLGRRIILAIVPPPPPLANKRYGSLPPLRFPRPIGEYKPTYSLETVNGKLPKFSTLANVYAVAVDNNRILGLDKIKAKARVLGFTNDPVEEQDKKTFTFKHPTLPAELVVDLIYGSYGYKYDWKNDAGISKGTDVPDKDESFRDAKNILNNLGLLPKDLADGQAKYTYLKSGPDGTFVKTNARSEANFVRVDMFRSDINKLPVVTTDGDTSSVNIIFSGVIDPGKKLIGANYNYSRILEDDFATYVLLPVDVAWKQLMDGNGYIVKRAGQTVIVRDVVLAYLETNQPQEYLQPVYVFGGDSGFLAYVPAVDASYPDRAATPK